MNAGVGVLGGGQLGQMLAQAAVSLGVRVRVLDPTEPRCPAAACAEQVMGSFQDPEAVAELATACTEEECGPCVMTVEIEHVDAEALEAVSALGMDVQPLPATLCVIQDKLEQKRHFRAQGVPTPDFQPVDDPEQLEAALVEFGFPLVLKARRLAYDGRGNAVIKSAGEVEEAVASLGGFKRGLYAERWVPFQKELAVMVARCKDGETRAFPLVETFHRDSILHVTEAPADVPPWTAKEAQQVAQQTVEALEGAGMFGVEMFVDDDGHVLLNEVAPRPHNSGHYSIEACHTSQFEQHLRCVLGWPLGDPTLKVGAAVMLNVLGEGEGEEGLAAAEALLSRALQVPGASVHWYGKEEVKEQRKVGHVTICAEDLPAARRKLQLLTEKEADVGDAPAAIPKAAQVGIIMGSDSDLPTMADAAKILEDFGVGCEVTVVSAHRTPERMVEYAREAHKRGVKVIIAGAGGAAHLPGMVAAMTPLPVIGVPVKPRGAYLDGLDSLLSIVQMPRGVPVATVAIGNSTNAGLLALRILGIKDAATLTSMENYQKEMEQTVLAKADNLEVQGWREYLAEKE